MRYWWNSLLVADSGSEVGTILVVAIVLPILVNLSTGEFVEWCPRLAKRVIEFAVQLQQPEIRKLREKEWITTLDRIPGRFSQLLWAVWIALYVVFNNRTAVLRQFNSKRRASKRYVSALPNYRLLTGTIIQNAILASISCMIVMRWITLPIWIAVIASLTLGVIVYNVDRWVVLSLSNLSTSTKGMLVRVLPQIALSVLFAVIVSMPLVLRIFEPAIQGEIESHRSVWTSETASRISSTYQRQLDATDRAIVRVSSEIQHLPKDKVSRELDIQLRVLRAKRQLLEAQRDSQILEAEANFQKTAGLLTRIKALDILAQKEPTVGMARWFITLYFVVVQTLPFSILILNANVRR